ncbi:MAG: DNA topoisomerase (ATP-hydrolyzing) [Anaerolineae bacterium]|nr:DNA topoisomerase (ATP-hydrolyzing) [Anaerolineae bacterium]
MDIGTVKKININDEMRDSYLSYAMSVIVSRALPDVRDGLKPVQRRILYAMHDMGLRPDQPYRKSARVVGEVLGKYHPHGDQSVYDAMVRMAQGFSMRYPLVDGQGNFGSIDGDAAAAMRYTEARIAPMGAELLEDIGKDTVDFNPNFDDTMREPEVLPATVPNLLVNGSSGIAVGMSTSIPPHNLGEVTAALIHMLDNWDSLDEITIKDLMAFIKGPDFPTGGVIFRQRADSDQDVLVNAYATGRGRVTVRARAHVEQMGRNKSRIVITELPYQTNKTNLIAKIADLHRDGRIEGLTDLRDESDRTGMRIVVETTRNVAPDEVLAKLFRLTPMESTFSIIMIALVNGEPRLLTLKQALRHYLDHRLDVVRRRSEHDLVRARDRAHVLEGLLTALDHLDAVIDIIRRSESVEMARFNLMRALSLSEVQAQAILDMPLRRLAALERQKIKQEYDEKRDLIARLERLLATPALMRTVVKEELLAVRGKYGDLRRTQIAGGSSDEPSVGPALLPEERTWVVVGQEGTLARTATATMIAVPAKPLEVPRLLLEANTQDILYLFTASGLATGLPIYQLAQAQTLVKGDHWATLTALARRDYVADALVAPPEASGYVFLTTLGGTCKRIRLEDLPGITTEPFTVINVAADDALGWARLTTGADEVILASAAGQAIRFAEQDVRVMGLRAGGVMAMKLDDLADGVVAMDLVRNGTYLWSISDNGMAKASPLDDYPTQGRYGKGVINMNLSGGAAQVVAAVAGDEGTRIIITTELGSTKTIRLGKTKTGSRHIKPEVLLRAGERNGVAGVVRVYGRPTFDAEGDEPGGAEQLSLLA